MILQPLPKPVNDLNCNIADLECQIIEGIELGEDESLISFWETVIDMLYDDMNKHYRAMVM